MAKYLSENANGGESTLWCHLCTVSDMIIVSTWTSTIDHTGVHIHHVPNSKASRTVAGCYDMSEKFTTSTADPRPS